MTVLMAFREIAMQLLLLLCLHLEVSARTRGRGSDKSRGPHSRACMMNYGSQVTKYIKSLD